MARWLSAVGPSRLARLAALLALLVLPVARSQDGEIQEEDVDGLDVEALTSEQMRKIHSSIDEEKDGRISLEEVLAFSTRVRHHIAKKDIVTIMDEMDTNKDGKMGLDELILDMDQWDADEVENKEDTLRSIEHETKKFQAADLDKDGFLSVEELPHLFYPDIHDSPVLHLTAEAALKHKDTDGDGMLNLREFWGEGEHPEVGDITISEEEHQDFQRLDLDKNGAIDIHELKPWESGKFHTEESLKRLIEIADADGDGLLTAAEFDEAKEVIAGSDAHYHLLEWTEHADEL